MFTLAHKLMEAFKSEVGKIQCVGWIQPAKRFCPVCISSLGLAWLRCRGEAQSKHAAGLRQCEGQACFLVAPAVVAPSFCHLQDQSHCPGTLFHLLCTHCQGRDPCGQGAWSGRWDGAVGGVQVWDR